ncbi:unnamed protein product [Agarophyton chilense]
MSKSDDLINTILDGGHIRDQNGFLYDIEGHVLSSKQVQDDSVSKIKYVMEGIQTKEHTTKTDTNPSTVKEAAALARKVLAALAGNSVEQVPYADGLVCGEKKHAPLPSNSPTTQRADVGTGRAPTFSTMQSSSGEDILYNMQTRDSMTAATVEEFVSASNISLAPIVDNRNVLDFVKAIDDANATFSSRGVGQTHLCDGPCPFDSLSGIDSELSAWKANGFLGNMAQLEHQLTEKDNLALQTQHLGHFPVEIVHASSGKNCEQDTYQTKSKRLTSWPSVTSVEDKSGTYTSFHRKNARDRRRALARRRTLLKREAEETRRMQKLVQSLLHLPEQERQEELMKIEQRQRDNENRRRVEEKRRLGRQAVERCRGRAGLSRQAMETQYKVIRNENFRLKRIIVYLLKSGVLHADELRKHRIFVAGDQTQCAPSIGNVEDKRKFVSDITEEQYESASTKTPRMTVEY